MAPAFDLNPDPRPGPKYLNTALDLDDNRASLDLLIEIAAYFRLDDDGARQILREVKQSTQQWRKYAKEMGVIPKDKREKLMIDINKKLFGGVYD